MRLAHKQDNVVIVINDPCQNPTGYRLTIEEWKEVRKIMVSASEFANIILILDIAYIDFDDRSFEEKQEYLETFKNLPEKVLTIFTFSLSKSLTCYGMRVGAQIALSTSSEVIEEFYEANSFSCRSTWSNISRGGMKMFSEIILDKEKSFRLEKRESSIETLSKRELISF